MSPILEGNIGSAVAAGVAGAAVTKIIDAFDEDADDDKRARRLEAVHDALRLAHEAATPIDYRFHRDGVAPAAGDFVFDLGSPDQGTVWHVRSLTVSGIDPTANIGGSLFVFVVGSKPDLTNPPVGSWRESVETLPSATFYAEHELTVKPGERLWAFIDGPDATTRYVAGVSAQVVQESAARQVVAV